METYVDANDSKTTKGPDWRKLAMAQGKVIERMADALRRIRDMEAFEFDQREVALEALNEGE